MRLDGGSPIAARRVDPPGGWPGRCMDRRSTWGRPQQAITGLGRTAALGLFEGLAGQKLSGERRGRAAAGQAPAQGLSLSHLGSRGSATSAGPGKPRGEGSMALGGSGGCTRRMRARRT